MPPGEGPAWTEAAAVLANSALSWIWYPEREGRRGLSEVPVIHRTRAASGRTAEQRLVGFVDRLILPGTERTGEAPEAGIVDVVDYKTDRVAGESGLVELEERYRPQLVAYRAALAAVRPESEIRLWLLFTSPGDPDGRGALRSVS
jgi:ATP-dependent exoDNAse (exonuclease V) beta subunit